MMSIDSLILQMNHSVTDLLELQESYLNPETKFKVGNEPYLLRLQ